MTVCVCVHVRVRARACARMRARACACMYVRACVCVFVLCFHYLLCHHTPWSLLLWQSAESTLCSQAYTRARIETETVTSANMIKETDRHHKTPTKETDAMLQAELPSFGAGNRAEDVAWKPEDLVRECTHRLECTLDTLYDVNSTRTSTPSARRCCSVLQCVAVFCAVLQ